MHKQLGPSIDEFYEAITETFKRGGNVIIPTFALERAQELLYENKVRSRRRTIAPSVVQGLVSCQKCGYAFSRTSTATTARKIHYYKCIGSDGWRKLGGPVCDNRMVRQDLLDQIVWTEVIRACWAVSRLATSEVLLRVVADQMAATAEATTRTTCSASCS